MTTAHLAPGGQQWPGGAGAGLVGSGKAPLGLGLGCENHTPSLLRGFPGGAVEKNPRANAGDMGSVPALGRPHIPWSN